MQPVSSLEEPISMLDIIEISDTYGIDDVGLIFQNPFWFFVYWELTEQGKRQAEKLVQSITKPVLRLFSKPPLSFANKQEDSMTIQDISLPGAYGKKYIEAQKAGSTVRVALGLLSEEGYFIPIASSSFVKLPHHQPFSKNLSHHQTHSFGIASNLFQNQLGHGSGGIL